MQFLLCLTDRSFHEMEAFRQAVLRISNLFPIDADFRDTKMLKYNHKWQRLVSIKSLF